jgi:hypothetical protein
VLYGILGGSLPFMSTKTRSLSCSSENLNGTFQLESTSTAYAPDGASMW